MYETFKALHQGGEAFVLANAWNAESAKIFQRNGFPAIGTSSAAVAKSMGYPDGEGMSFAAYLFIIRRMAEVMEVPFSVDLEMGFGETVTEIQSNISQLSALGVVGINLEDSRIVNGKRVLQDAYSFAERLSLLREAPIFINVRCDTYLLGVSEAQAQTARRAQLYQAAGADGLFLPCILSEEDISAAIAATTLPVNVMSMPGLPDIHTLSRLGVKRLSMGPALFEWAYAQLNQCLPDSFPV
jgi:2-methylisocitrate lyase-like PEP mutase family enzyme